MMRLRRRFDAGRYAFVAGFVTVVQEYVFLSSAAEISLRCFTFSGASEGDSTSYDRFS